MRNRYFSIVITIAFLFLVNHLSFAGTVKELQIRNGIHQFIQKAQKIDTLTVAYLGGSITEQDGWRVYSQQTIKKSFPKLHIIEVNATIGGTGSDFGVFRLAESVLKHKPDLLFVEFAVNDDGMPAQKIQTNIESIIRLTKVANPLTDIVLVYTLKEDFLSVLKEKKYPVSVVTMEKVADHYGLASINYIPEVYKRLMSNELIIKNKEKNVNNIPVFSPDGVHPYTETGHKIYAEVFERSFSKILKVKPTKANKQLPEPVSTNCLQNPKTIPFSYLYAKGKWEKQQAFSSKIQRQINTLNAQIFKTAGSDNSISFRFRGTAVGFSDLLGPGSGRVLVEIDNTIKDTILRFDAWSGSWRLSYKVYQGLADKEHEVKLTAINTPFDKSKIVSSEKIKANPEFELFNWYPVAILLDCDLLFEKPLAKNQSKFLGNIANDRPDASFKEIWNQITPENTTKWQRCEPNDNNWTFERPKGIYDYCKQNGLKFKFHTLIWGSTYPLWIDSLKTDAELKAAMEDWIRKAGETFPEAEYVDVVNEPMFGHEAPFFRRAIGGMYDLYGTGWDWVIWSFEQARKAFPNSKLLINDFNILKNKHNIKRYSEIIRLLRERNLIDGIGCQAHWIEGRSGENIKQGLDSLVSLNPGLDIYISELEFNVKDDNEQLEKMKDIFPTLWEHPAVKGITFWGYKHSWVGKNGVLVRNDIDRPAMIWLKSYVSN